MGGRGWYRAFDARVVVAFYDAYGSRNCASNGPFYTAFEIECFSYLCSMASRPWTVTALRFFTHSSSRSVRFDFGMKCIYYVRVVWKFGSENELLYGWKSRGKYEVALSLAGILSAFVKEEEWHSVVYVYYSILFLSDRFQRVFVLLTLNWSLLLVQYRYYRFQYYHLSSRLLFFCEQNRGVWAIRDLIYAGNI